MNKIQGDPAEPGTWKKYFPVVMQFLLFFYLGTFSIAWWFYHKGMPPWTQIIPIGIIYIIINVTLVIRMIRKLPLVAIMLAAPMVPLCMLLLVLSMLPILQLLG